MVWRKLDTQLSVLHRDFLNPLRLPKRIDSSHFHYIIERFSITNTAFGSKLEIIGIGQLLLEEDLM